MNERYPEVIFEEDKFQDSEIDLKQVFFTILKYKWSILALAITVSVLTSMWTYTLVDIYRGTSSLLIEAEESKIVSIEEIYGLSTDSWEYYETQLHILKSRALASKVFDVLNLEKHPEFLPRTKPKSSLPSFNIMGWIKKGIKNLLPDDLPDEVPGEEKPRVPMDTSTRKNILVGGLMGRLDVKLLSDTQIITLSYNSEYPDLAASVPNALAEAYINSFLEADIEKTQQATSWITGRTSELRKKFEESERQLQAFIEEENMVDVERVNNLATKELGTLSSGLVEARRERSEADALYQQIKSIRDGNSIEQLESLPAVLNHPLFSSSYATRALAQR